MAGIYIHVPFCKTRCIYCDFYSSTNEQYREEYVKALCRELEERKEYLGEDAVETVYFGGGTPSRLTRREFDEIFNTLAKHFDLSQVTEYTIEGNPDDLSEEYLMMLGELPFNRISIGVQTFHNKLLQQLGRRHDTGQAIQAILKSREAGFWNLSIDLIYGLPGQTIDMWESDVIQALDLFPEHLSAYMLTYEEGTKLHAMRKEKRICECREEDYYSFYLLLTDYLLRSGYEHYEISNFCLPGQQSKHNSSYWTDAKYLGCGPAAHSYNGVEREWNVRSVEKYIKGMARGKRPAEVEHLTPAMKYNDHVMLRLRTKWGIDLNMVEEQFGPIMHDYCIRMALPYINRGLLIRKGECISMTPEGVFLSNQIMSDLMWVP